MQSLNRTSPAAGAQQTQGQHSIRTLQIGDSGSGCGCGCADDDDEMSTTVSARLQCKIPRALHTRRCDMFTRARMLCTPTRTPPPQQNRTIYVALCGGELILSLARLDVGVGMECWLSVWRARLCAAQAALQSFKSADKLISFDGLMCRAAPPHMPVSSQYRRCRIYIHKYYIHALLYVVCIYTPSGLIATQSPRPDGLSAHECHDRRHRSRHHTIRTRVPCVCVCVCTHV